MRIVNYDGQLAALVGNGVVTLGEATQGRFGDDVVDALSRWDEVTDAVAQLEAQLEAQPALEPEPLVASRLLAPVPHPRQVFAIGLNYKDHAEEAGITTLPREPVVFTKFPASLTGPEATVALPSANVDYEVELTVVIGRRAERVSEDQAWQHVAGLMVGQDLSERKMQLAGPMPQFSLAKSFPGFGPTGPAIVTIDEVPDFDALDLGCRIGDELLQSGNTKDMIFGVPELIARLSRVCPLLPGDLIFTGTPAGVGMGRRPPRFLLPGDTLTTFVGSLGEIHTTFVAGVDFTSES